MSQKVKSPARPCNSLQPRKIGILGGMGPAAGADFARLFVVACTAQMHTLNLPVTDQNFPEHWLAQIPLPDRTRALLDTSLGFHQPLDGMLHALGSLSALGVTAVALACNTAHAWHQQLQQRFPNIDVLHIAREVAKVLAQQGTTRCGLLATEGVYRTGLYETALSDAGVKCHLPQHDERARLMLGIYDGVKAANLGVARHSFVSVATALANRHDLSVLILGCTEIPLVLDLVPNFENLQLVNPAVVLADALASRAYRTTVLDK
jgi:aspartate racemase